MMYFWERMGKLNDPKNAGYYMDESYVCDADTAEDDQVED